MFLLQGSVLTVNMCLFTAGSCPVFHVLCFLLTSPFKMSPMHSPGKVWCRRLGCAFRSQGLDKLLLGAFSVRESPARAE